MNFCSIVSVIIRVFPWLTAGFGVIFRLTENKQAHDNVNAMGSLLLIHYLAAYPPAISELHLMAAAAEVHGTFCLEPEQRGCLGAVGFMAAAAIELPTRTNRVHDRIHRVHDRIRGP